MSKKNRDELKQAEQLFRNRQFASVIRHLAPQIFLYRGNHRYYYLLGIASLYVGDFSGAHSYIQRGLDLKPQDKAMLSALAMCHLYRKEVPQAMTIWLSLVEQRPVYTKARRALEIVKRTSGRVDWPTLLREGSLRKAYPAPGIRWKLVAKVSGIAAGALSSVVLVLLIVLSIDFSYSPLANENTLRTPDRGINEIVNDSDPRGLVGRVGPVVQSGLENTMSIYSYEPHDIDLFMQQVGTYFREYRDNLARILMNRILLSNASDSQKERMRSLYVHLKEPGFTDFKDNVVYLDVIKDPVAFEGVFVRWQGRVDEVVRSNDKMQFNLLLGYHEGRVVEAELPVHIFYPVDIHTGEGVEVIGELRFLKLAINQEQDPADFVSIGTERYRVWLRAAAIRKIRVGS